MRKSDPIALENPKHEEEVDDSDSSSDDESEDEESDEESDDESEERLMHKEFVMLGKH